MATAIRDTTRVSGGSGTGTNCDTPTGTTSGDTCVVLAAINNNPTWVDNNGANALSKDLAYEPATNQAFHIWSIRPSSGNISGWGGTPDFTAGASTRWSMCMLTFSDPDGSAIWDVTPSSGDGTVDDTGASTTITVKALTATTDAILIIAIVADGNTTTITTTNMTGQGFTVLENGGNQGLCLITKDVSAGSTGTFSFTSAVPAATQWISFPVLIRKAGAATATGSGGSVDAVQLTEGKGTSTATGFGATSQAAQATAATGKATATGSGGSFAAPQATAATGSAAATGSGGSSGPAQLTAGTGLGLGQVVGAGGSSSAAQATAATGSAVATGSGGSIAAAQTSAGKGAATVTGVGATGNAAQRTAATGAVAAVGKGGSTAAPQVTTGYNPGGEILTGGNGQARRRLPPNRDY